MKTFYHQEILRINRQLYPRDYITQQILQAKSHIDRHYASPLSLQEMAQAAFISKFHFARLFKTYYGRTPHQCLTDVRMMAAKRLLMEGASVMETCHAVGFESVGSFSSLFKKATGTTPATCRKRSRKR